VVEHRGSPTKFLRAVDGCGVSGGSYVMFAGPCCGFSAQESNQEFGTSDGQWSRLLLSKALQWPLKFCVSSTGDCGWCCLVVNRSPARARVRRSGVSYSGQR
jgi:hypothetical protein